ncbi:MAG: imelysin family protein [Marinobacter sp.]
MLALLMAASSASADPLSQWHSLIDAGYARLASETGNLENKAKSYCESPAQETRSQLSAQWRTAFEAWQAVRFVDFGPVEQNNLAWQFQFWPDPKNLVARKAGQLLKSPAADISMAQRVSDGGVAVQGFPVVEYLLFDDRLNESAQALPAEPACLLLQAVSTHLHTNTMNLHRQWQTFRPHYLNRDSYRSTSMKAAMTALEILVERRLAEPMGLRGNGKRSIYPADAWRSGHSLAAIRASVKGLHHYFLPGFTLWMDETNEQALAQRIEDQWSEVVTRLDELPDAMAPLLRDESFSRLQGLHVSLSQLQQLLNDQAATSLGVIRGFNSSDGD